MKRPSQKLVDAFFEWYRAIRTLRTRITTQGALQPRHFKVWAREQFIEFFFRFAHDGGKVQSGGQRTAPLFRKTIEDKYDSFRDFVLAPFAEDSTS